MYIAQLLRKNVEYFIYVKYFNTLQFIHYQYFKFFIHNIDVIILKIRSSFSILRKRYLCFHLSVYLSFSDQIFIKCLDCDLLEFDFKIQFVSYRKYYYQYAYLFRTAVNIFKMKRSMQNISVFYCFHRTKRCTR